MPAHGVCRLLRSAAINRMKRPGHFLVYLLLRVVVSIIQALSMETCAAGIRLLAWLMCDAIRFRAPTIDENLRVALPEATPQQRHKISRRMWRHLFMMLVEIIHAPRK